MNRVVLFLLLLSCTGTLRAQYNLVENRVWVFGARAGLDFNPSTPQPVLTAISGGGGSYEASASVCDRFGRLLFYTNGEAVWTRNHLVIPNGNRLPPASSYSVVSSSAQGTIILPMIDSPDKYYIFSITCWEQKQVAPQYDGRLFYTVVDMARNNGWGDVDPARKWVQVDSGLTEQLIAVSGNRNNIWLVTHANDTNQFRVWEITAAGISAAPDVYTTGLYGSSIQGVGINPVIYSNAWWTFGQMAIAPDRKKLAAVFSRPNYAELYDFDPCTGAITNALMFDTIRQNNQVNYLTHIGVAFSPDSRKLYVSALKEDFVPGNDRYLYQFDISNPTLAAIAASKTKLGPIDNTKIRLGPNGHIYGRASSGGLYLADTLNAVLDPNQSGLACQYTLNHLVLQGRVQIGLGNDFVKSLQVPLDTVWNDPKDTLVCAFPVAGIPLTVPDGFSGYLWEDSTADSIRHVYAAGEYRLTYTDGCQVYVDVFRVAGRHIPPFEISGPDTVLCGIDSVRLLIPVSATAYRWQDGQETPEITVTESGTYVATITQDGCSVSDTIDIRFVRQGAVSDSVYVFCNMESISLLLSGGAPAGASVMWSDGSTGPVLPVSDSGSYWVTVTESNCVFHDSFLVQREICDCFPKIPNAFTPNGDGKNDVFRSFVVDDCIIHEYSLRVFDRWGALVFASIAPASGWDGNFRGVPAPAGTYMYHVRMTAGTSRKAYEFKGDLTLIR